MKIYEIQRVGFERMLMELQQTDIEQRLADTASSIDDASSARQGDLTGTDPMADPMGGDPMATGMPGQPGAGMGGMGMDPMGGAPAAAGMPGLEPDPSMMNGDGLDGAQELETKKIDSAIISQVQGMPYVEKYDHGDSKVSPERIMQMEVDELTQLRNASLNTINMIRLNDKVGLYDDPETKWYEDLRDFVDKVLNMKKKADQPVKKRRQGKSAKWEEKPKSKNSKSRQYRKPPKPKGA